LLEFFTFFGVKLELAPDEADSEVAHKESIRHHQGEEEKAQEKELLQHQAYRDDYKEDHQRVEESTGPIVLPPPVVGFGRANEHFLTVGPTPPDSNPDIHLRSLTPERLEIMDAGHLMRTVIEALKADLAEVVPNEGGQVVGAFADRLHGRSGNRGIE